MYCNISNSGLDKDVDLSPWRDEAFLQEVGNYLILNGLNDKFLLAARTSKDAKNQGVQYVELNYDGKSFLFNK